MPTKKELLAGLLQETEELGESLDTTAEASSELCAGLESLRSDIAGASERFETIADETVANLSDRLSAFRRELEATFKDGASTLRDGLIEGHLIGGLMGGLVGGLIQNALHARTTDPRWIIARRTYEALHIVADAYNAGDRHGYNSTLRLLRVHEFNAEQARYILDLLLRAGAVKEYEDDDEEIPFIMIDPESEAFQKISEGISKNTLTYLTVGAAPTADENEG